MTVVVEKLWPGSSPALLRWPVQAWAPLAIVRRPRAHSPVPPLAAYRGARSLPQPPPWPQALPAAGTETCREDRS